MSLIVTRRLTNNAAPQQDSDYGRAHCPQQLAGLLGLSHQRRVMAVQKRLQLIEHVGRQLREWRSRSGDPRLQGERGKDNRKWRPIFRRCASSARSSTSARWQRSERRMVDASVCDLKDQKRCSQPASRHRLPASSPEIPRFEYGYHSLPTFVGKLAERQLDLEVFVKEKEVVRKVGIDHGARGRYPATPKRQAATQNVGPPNPRLLTQISAAPISNTNMS